MIKALILFLVLFPLLISVPGYFIAKKWPKCREWFFISTNVIELVIMVIVALTFKNSTETSFVLEKVIGLGLSFKADTFRVIYASISIFLWLMTITFSKEYMHHYEHKERYYLFYLLTLCGVVGVFFSNDLFTTFVFFEIMSFASYPLVIHEEKEEAMKAGETYLAIAVISGMILLVGLFFVYNEVNSLSFEAIKEFTELNGVTTYTFVGGILMLFGFGAKAGMYPLHIWLPKAHPVAPAPASALLSGILTKTGVFGIIVISANIFLGNVQFASILLSLAVITMFLGALLGLFSTNLKRTLACSSMSQIGFILVGISFMILLGEEGGLAQCGALLHMANHSLIKLVLFMCAGVVAMNIHALELNDIKGFGRKKPFLMIIFLIGALGIMGIPGFNGYVSKTMIHEAIVEYITEEALTGGMLVLFKSIEWIFLASGGLTVAYMTKLFVCLFIEKNEDSEKQAKFDNMKHYMSPLSIVVFVLSAIIIPVIGVLPNIINSNIIADANAFFGVERFTHHVEFFGWESLKGGLISIGIGAALYGLVRVFFIKKGKYVDLWPSKLDLEFILYRPIIVDFSFIIVKYVVRPIALCLDLIILGLNKTILKAHTYKFNDETVPYRIGKTLDSYTHKDDHFFAKKIDAFANTLKDYIDDKASSFSFALGMIATGIIIVLIFAIFISL